MQRTLRLAALTRAPLLVLLSIWLPVWQHYRVPEAHLDRATIDSLRANPPDARLLELQRQAQEKWPRSSEQLSPIYKWTAGFC
jgi:tRNA U34 5-methylaminomethyl-2-thiouridine-forming methyltransferase MnmC